MIHCKHWITCTNKDGGCCTAGLMGGMPSYGSCLGSCAEYTGTEDDRKADWQFVRDRAKRIKSKPSVQAGEIEKAKRLSVLEAARRIGAGVVGLVKAELHIDRASEHVIEARRNICKSCEHCVPCGKSPKRKCCGKMGNVLRATETCGCVIEKKISIASETCPLDAPRW